MDIDNETDQKGQKSPTNGKSKAVFPPTQATQAAEPAKPSKPTKPATPVPPTRKGSKNKLDTKSPPKTKLSQASDAQTQIRLDHTQANSAEKLRMANIKTNGKSSVSVKAENNIFNKSKNCDIGNVDLTPAQEP